MPIYSESLNINNEQPKPQKPMQSFNQLVNTLSQQGKRIECLPGDILRQRTDNEKVNCYVLQSGHYTLVRSRDDLALTNVSAPMVVGLPEVFQPMVAGMYYLRVETTGVITRLDGEMVAKIISESNMWESFGQVLSYFTCVLYQRDNELFGQSVYHMVRYFLREMMQAPTELRMLNNVAHYILQRSQVSRSSVMRIISQLRIGGYIVVQNGRLIKINSLPEFY
ncbi:putative DNA-binding transcriptional regulator [Serratia quinivorans]|uniref:helix-turn-helix domain-containing protein n=1 Tax=Serratia quinivorans TaxID=137545 RepID=UPI002178BAB0|nr:helix-turn-helix domain-containing protein [Serratia quinivorans]CAI1603960.1 putative DNA-binding transcriptional regulator [Serratia quinivorans]